VARSGRRAGGRWLAGGVSRACVERQGWDRLSILAMHIYWPLHEEASRNKQTNRMWNRLQPFV
jgi:hypothetical protein